MKLEKLIASSHSLEEAEAYSKFVPSDAEMTMLEETGIEVLKNISPEAGACALMSAVYANLLKKRKLHPVYMVAGSLAVGRQYVFGTGHPLNGDQLSTSNMDWDGHAWIMFGPYIADISIFRTAYSKRSPRLLASHIRKTFGEGRGLMIVRWSDAPKSDLRYSPHHVLTDDQIMGLVSGAYARFTKTA
jgi:hypothetical protein